MLNSFQKICKRPIIWDYLRQKNHFDPANQFECNDLKHLRAAEVGAFAGIDADFFAFVDEGGDLDY
jgi:hypothetical protein